MRRFTPPDVIVLGGLVIATAVVVFVLGWPTKETYGWRTFLFMALPAAHTCFSIYWLMGGSSWRLRAFRVYYRFFGPRCHIQVLGIIQLDPSYDDAKLLKGILSVAKAWDPDAKETLHISNRSVIQAGARTLTVDSVNDDIDDDYGEGWNGEDLEEGGSESSFRQAHIDLRGYEGTLTRMEALLRGEVVSLLDRLDRELSRQQTRPNFSLMAHIKGANPFLLFYLRDVPSADVSEFRLQLTKREHGNPVSVTVTADSVIVAAQTPSALVESASRYLAAPALSARS